MADNMVKWGLIGVGGYLVLKYLGYDPLTSIEGWFKGTTSVSTAGAGVPVPTGTGTTGSTPISNPVQSSASQVTTAQAVLAAASADNVDVNSYQTTDLWNWYYQKVRGIAAPSPETLFPGVDRNMKHSFSEWWGAMTSNGLSGVYGGMGIIANYVNPYAMSFRTLGASIQPTGFERFSVRVN